MAGVPSSESFAVIEQARRHLDSVCSSDTAGRGTDADRAALSRQLLEESQLLYEMSFEYKARANALLPVGRLPREILLFIFSIVADNQPPHLAVNRQDFLWAECFPDESEPDDLDWGDKTKLPATIGWICLTHVSRFWRALCLSSPTLWAKGVGRLPKAITEFFRRSGATAPVQIRIRRHAFPTSPSSVFGVVPVERIQMIDWDISEPEQASELINNLCVNSLTSLELLKLQILASDEEPPAHTGGTLTAPRLSMLMFAGLFVPFSAPNLTVLSIRFIEFSAVELLRTCSKCPQLRTLELLDLKLTDMDTVQGSSIHTTLAHLKTFIGEIRTDIQSYNTLLQHMAIPSSVELSLWPSRRYEVDAENIDHGSLAVTVANLLWRYKPCTIIYIRGVRITFNSYEGEEEVERADIITNDYSFDMLAKLLPDVKLRSFFKDINVLWIHAEHDTREKPTIVYLFNMLPNVSQLHIFRGRPRSETQADIAPTRMLFHSLWSDASNDTPLRRLEEIHLKSTLDTTPIYVTEDILQALSRRAKVVSRLKLLNLECFEYHEGIEQIVALLRKYVDEIRWKEGAE